MILPGPYTYFLCSLYSYPILTLVPESGCGRSPHPHHHSRKDTSKLAGSALQLLSGTRLVCAWWHKVVTEASSGPQGSLCRDQQPLFGSQWL